MGCDAGSRASPLGPHLLLQTLRALRQVEVTNLGLPGAGLKGRRRLIADAIQGGLPKLKVLSDPALSLRGSRLPCAQGDSCVGSRVQACQGRWAWLHSPRPSPPPPPGGSASSLSPSGGRVSDFSKRRVTRLLRFSGSRGVNSIFVVAMFYLADRARPQTLTWGSGRLLTPRVSWSPCLLAPVSGPASTPSPYLLGAELVIR